MSESISLPGLGVNPDLVTIAGMSAGSFMANQMHVAYSDLIKGAGLIIGGPYGSWSMFKGENEEKKTITEADKDVASQWLIDNHDRFVKLAEDNEKEGKVAALSNLKESSVYIWGSLQE